MQKPRTMAGLFGTGGVDVDQARGFLDFNPAFCGVFRRPPARTPSEIMEGSYEDLSRM
jgi:hypothetical protein